MKWVVDIFNSLRETMRTKGIAIKASVVEGGIPHILKI